MKFQRDYKGGGILARLTSYGMGQYRSNTASEWSFLSDVNLPDNSISYEDVDYGTGLFRDVKISLPTDDNTKMKYGNSYYIELELPQNEQFDMVIDLKLCSESNGNMNANQYQFIKRLVIPPMKMGEVYSNILLYEWQNNNNESPELHSGIVYNTSDNCKSEWDVYTKKISESVRYYLKDVTNDNNYIKNYTTYSLLQGWKLGQQKSTVIYKFIFSPKYDLDFSYLWLNINRTLVDNMVNNLQFIDNNKTYQGLNLDTSEIKCTIKKVNSLLGVSSTDPYPININKLNHIGIWGHPEQAFAINGEEIKLGQSGYYELNDYEITSLGAVVLNPEKDQFTIDYEYEISN